MPNHVIGILGGAVSGSEAAAIAAQRGAYAIVLEQNERPYGKIEDGLPRWHVALRNKEYARIDENLTHPNIMFVPKTKLGRDVEWDVFTKELGLSAVVLANGAWRDRPQPAAIDAFNGRGLVYQNPFVYWFNHQKVVQKTVPSVARAVAGEASEGSEGSANIRDYRGGSYEIPDGAIVIGGGLASIDCVKIINFDLYGRALRERGIEVDAEQMEHEGLRKILTDHGLTVEELGIQGATLFYRRRAEDMPIVSSDEGNAARMAKLEQTRVKLLSKVLEKYLVKFVPLASPLAPLTDQTGLHLTGVRFQKNAFVDGKLVATDEVLDVKTALVVSSIGSIPEDLPGVPMKGELYKWKNWETGKLDSEAEVYGLGNVLTGKGNIVESRKNSKKVMGRLVEARLGLADGTPAGDAELDAEVEAAHAAARAEIMATIDSALDHEPLSDEVVARIKRWVESRWEAVGYGGEYRAWIEAHRP